MKAMIKHIASLLAFAFFIAIAAASFSKATEPCEYKEPDYSSKDIVIEVVDRETFEPIPEASVQIVVRDFNPKFDPIYAECDYSAGVTLQSVYNRNTDEQGLAGITTELYEHDNIADYTEITVSITAPEYWPVRDVQVLYYKRSLAYFHVSMINSNSQP